MAAAPPRSVLIICTRRIGDVLLTTPLIRSLRRAWPAARLTALVFGGTEGALEGNPDIADVITVPARSPWRQRLGELRRLWRSYDLAIATLPSDRARIYAWAAGRRRLGFVASGESGSKRWWLDEAAVFDDRGVHTVARNLQLAALAGVAPICEVVAPRGCNTLPVAFPGPYAVLHPFPKFNYKMWQESCWSALGAALHQRGFRIVLTGSGDAAEMAYCARVAATIDATLPASVVNLAGKITLGQTADLLRCASLYVGPDTAVTHIAAATGIPVLALFGPSDPVTWGPWPIDAVFSDSPWPRIGSTRRGNVLLLQGQGDCVPCLLEGCDRHTGSYSRCLQELRLERVLDGIEKLLGGAQTVCENPLITKSTA